jgi:hypothetical protein
MAKSEPLVQRIYFDKLYTEICRAVGYVGFPFRELAERMQETVKAHGAAKVAAALRELLTHAGQRTMPLPEARKWCGQLLGPPPEKWDEFYRGLDGKPMKRPPGKETVPVIPPAEHDPFIAEFCRLADDELKSELWLAQRGSDTAKIQALESELIRRGVELPERPAEVEKAPEPKKRGRAGKRTRK